MSSKDDEIAALKIRIEGLEKDLKARIVGLDNECHQFGVDLWV